MGARRVAASTPAAVVPVAAVVLVTAVVLAAAVVLVVVPGCGRPAGPVAGRSAGPAGWSTVAEVEGATLSTRRTGSGTGAGGGAAYLQRIDLRRMRVDQVLGEVDAAAVAEPGRYVTGSTSPRFRRVPPGELHHRCRDRYGPATFSAVNFAFFEDYAASTQLAFPVRLGGRVVTGGSSPYGPVAAPKDPYYRTVTLRMLTWDANGAAIVAYTGEPIGRPGPPDAVVSYRYEDHPSRVHGDPVNRYQLLGVSADGTVLLILTVTRSTLTDAGGLLRKEGAVGDILTFDGGVSTYLWSAAAGELVPVTNGDGALPHYLCVHAAP